MNEILKFEYQKGKQQVFPAHNLVKNWLFTADEHREAALAHFMAEVAEKNGLGVNDIAHIYPLVLRMLKSKIDWAK